MNTTEVGELLYRVTLNITGMKEYGVNFTALMAGEVTPPVEGARFDVAFEGTATGPKLNGAAEGIDYVRVRADGRLELHIHETISTEDGQNISAHGDGLATLRPEGGIADVRVNMTLLTSSKDYAWVNQVPVRGIGTIDLAKQSLSSFYKYLGAAAAELRLPIIVANPAHSQFIPRLGSDPIDQTQALTTTRARQLMGFPSGDSLIDYRDGAILKFYLYSGARLATGCRLKVNDFHVDENGATVRISEKGERRRKIGLHFVAAQAIQEYISHAGIDAGPLFRPRLNSRSEKLGQRQVQATAMYNLILSYLARLPKAVREVVKTDGSKTRRCIYTPHSLRATAATLLLEAGVDITKVQAVRC